MDYEIVSIDDLLPLEKVFFSHLKNLEEMINNDGFLLKAIIADKKTGTILDGSHRYVYLLKNGYKTAPVHWVDYNNENIRVGTKLRHRFSIKPKEDIGISKDECTSRALTGDLFPPRTTRHFFTFRKDDIVLPLDKLKKGDVMDTSHLISKKNINAEIIHNKKYIEEINEEFEIIIEYLSEVLQVKKYLGEQITNSNQRDNFPFWLF